MATGHAARAHARFSPSSAHRWTVCPGSVILSDGLPERRSRYAEEGTLAHELLEAWLLRRWNTVADLVAKAPADMVEAVAVAVEYVRGLGGDQDYEVRVQLPFGDDEFGTCDVIAKTDEALHVVDYKHGVGVKVEAEKNLQLACYALGAIAQDMLDDSFSVHCTIIQPRAGGDPISTWATTVGELVTVHLPAFRRATLEARVDNLTSGPHCKWCPAAENGVCPKLRETAVACFGAVDLDFDQAKTISLPDAKDVPVERIGEVLAVAPILEGWFTDLRARAEEILREGGVVPGQKLVEQKARRAWDADEGTLPARLSKITEGALAPDTFLRTSPVPLTEAEKLLAQWARSDKRKTVSDVKNELAQLTLRASSGKLVLAPESDPRPSARPGDAFSAVNVAALGGTENGDAADG